MNTTHGKRAWGVSVFCDDLRQEIGNKVSLMGLYQTDIIFQADFPLTIPKFVIFIRYVEQKGAFSEDIIFKVHFPGDDPAQPRINHISKRPDLGTAPILSAMDPDMEPIVSIQVPLIFAPLTIQSEGFIKVRAHCGDVITRLGVLRVRKAAEKENAA